MLKLILPIEAPPEDEITLEDAIRDAVRLAGFLNIRVRFYLGNFQHLIGPQDDPVTLIPEFLEAKAKFEGDLAREMAELLWIESPSQAQENPPG